MEVSCCVEAGGETLEEDQSFLSRSGGAYYNSVLALPLAIPSQCPGHTRGVWRSPPPPLHHPRCSARPRQRSSSPVGPAAALPNVGRAQMQTQLQRIPTCICSSSTSFLQDFQVKPATRLSWCRRSRQLQRQRAWDWAGQYLWLLRSFLGCHPCRLASGS